MFDIQGAKKEGYTDSEITEYLAPQAKFNLTDARKEGYTDTEILNYLAKTVKRKSFIGIIADKLNPPAPQEIAPVAMPSSETPNVNLQKQAGVSTLNYTGKKYSTPETPEMAAQAWEKLLQPVSKSIGMGEKEPFIIEGSDTAQGYYDNFLRGLGNTAKGMVDIIPMLAQIPIGIAKNVFFEPIGKLVEGKGKEIDTSLKGNPLSKEITGFADWIKTSFMPATNPDGTDNWATVLQNIFQNPEQYALAYDMGKGAIKKGIALREKAMNKPVDGFIPTIEAEQAGMPLDKIAVEVEGIRAKTGKVFKHKITAEEALKDPDYFSQRQEIVAQIKKQQPAFEDTNATEQPTIKEIKPSLGKESMFGTTLPNGARIVAGSKEAVLQAMKGYGEQQAINKDQLINAMDKKIKGENITTEEQGLIDRYLQENPYKPHIEQSNTKEGVINKLNEMVNQGVSKQEAYGKLTPSEKDLISQTPPEVVRQQAKLKDGLTIPLNEKIDNQTLGQVIADVKAGNITEAAKSVKDAVEVKGYDKSEVEHNIRNGAIAKGAKAENIEAVLGGEAKLPSAPSPFEPETIAILRWRDAELLKNRLKEEGIKASEKIENDMHLISVETPTDVIRSKYLLAQTKGGRYDIPLYIQEHLKSAKPIPKDKFYFSKKDIETYYPDEIAKTVPNKTITKQTLTPKIKGDTALEQAVPDVKTREAQKGQLSIEEEPKAKEPTTNIETPLQGALNSALEQKKITWKKAKELRERIKNEPLGGNRHGLRLELLKWENAHNEALKAERQSIAQIEKRANELGQTIMPKSKTRNKVGDVVEADGKNAGIIRGDILNNEAGFVKIPFSDPSLFGKPKPQRLKTIKDTVDYYVGVISTRLANIAPELKTKVRRTLFNEGMKINGDMEGVKPFIEKFKQLNEQTKFDLTKALINSDIKEAIRIMKENNMSQTYGSVAKTFARLKREAQEAGYDIKDIPNYFVRVVGNPKELLNELYGKNEWSIIDRAIKEVEQKLGTLTDEHKAQIADTMLRGFPREGVSLKQPYTDPTHTKTRALKQVPEELVKYYLPADEALIKYIQSMNTAIEKARFFGKHKDINMPLFENQTSLDASIGNIVMDLKQRKKITPEQEIELKGLLGAVFQPRHTGQLTRTVKEATYLATLGNVGSALTQIQDLALVAEKSGFWGTARGAFKREITMKDIGIDSIAHELQERGSLGFLLDTSLKLTGFKALDKFGKETLLNAQLVKYRKMARAENTLKLDKKLSELFGEDANKVKQDLSAGKNTEDVKFLLFNELSDIQPITMAEVPEAYLRTSGGKIFYALKTYQIKLFDVYRNEIFGEIRKGNVREGITKLIRLSSALAIMGATAEELKDFMFGRQTDFSDKVIDNVLKLGGFSKYTTWIARKEGIGTAVWKTVSPPIGIIDDISKDVGDTIKTLDTEPRFKDKEQKYQFPKYVPLFGKPYYWWFGKGADIKKRDEIKRHSNERRK